MGWAKAWVRGVGRSVGTTVTVTLTGSVNDVLGCHLSLQGPGAPCTDAPPVAMAAPPLPPRVKGRRGAFRRRETGSSRPQEELFREIRRASRATRMATVNGASVAMSATYQRCHGGGGESPLRSPGGEVGAQLRRAVACGTTALWRIQICKANCTEARLSPGQSAPSGARP